MTRSTDPAPTPDPDPLLQVLLAGRYRVVRALGAGGMGVVYLARDEHLARDVVVKFPHAAMLLERGYRARFEQELRALIRFEHPHVVKALDFGEHAGAPFAVLQYLSGGSLADRLLRERRQTLEQVQRWAAAIAGALDALHARGGLHRDVKPENILFDEHGHAHLADFGIAKALDSTTTSLTLTGAIVGSPTYMAPEVSDGDALTPAYDQYALAVVVYEALGGELPHASGTPLQVLKRKSIDPPRPLETLAPDLPAHVHAAVARALSAAPAARFRDCAAFAQGLAASFELASEVTAAASSSVEASSGVARGEPTYAPSALTRARSRVRMFAGGRRGALLAFALLAIAVGWWLLGGAPKSADESVSSAATAERASEPQSQRSAPRASPAAAQLTLTSLQEDTRYESESEVIVRIRSDVALASATVERQAMLLDPDARGATAKLRAPTVNGTTAREVRWTLRAVTLEGASTDLDVRFMVTPKPTSSPAQTNPSAVQFEATEKLGASEASAESAVRIRPSTHLCYSDLLLVIEVDSSNQLSRVLVDGEIATLRSGSTFTVSKELKFGHNQIEICATDISGRSFRLSKEYWIRQSAESDFSVIRPHVLDFLAGRSSMEKLIQADAQIAYFFAKTDAVRRLLGPVRAPPSALNADAPWLIHLDGKQAVTPGRNELILAQWESRKNEDLYAVADLAYKRFKSGEFESAEELWVALVLYNPYDSYFHSALGAVLQKQSRFTEATTQYTLAIKYNPRDITAFANRGETYLLLGDRERALVDLQSAAALDPGGGNPWGDRARRLLEEVSQKR